MSMFKLSQIDVPSGGVATITFSSIPQNYTDLMVLFSLRSNRTTANTDDLLVTFNNDSGTNYSTRLINGDGSTTACINYGPTTSFIFSSYSTDLDTANTFGNGTMYIPNYTSSTLPKDVQCDQVAENNAGGAVKGLSFNAGYYTGTAAITRIALAPRIGTLFNQYSSVSLYGILKG